MAKVEMLDKRRMVQLMNIIYETRLQLLNERVVVRNTRQAEKYIFDINRVNLELYSRSPYHIGPRIWNNLPKNIQDLNTKEKFKCATLDRL